MTGHADRLLLSTSEAGKLLEVHPSTVKRWADQGLLPVTRTRGGHRRFHLKDLLGGASDQGIPTFLDRFHPWEANVWLALRAGRDEGDFSALISLALSWLRQGETDLLGRLFFEMAQTSEIPFPRFLDQGVRGFMARVGEEWQRGRLQVGEEHMASEVIQEAFVRLRMAREASQSPAAVTLDQPPVAVVGAAEGDHHDLGARAIRAILERDGWRVYFLGGNVPIEDFARIQQAQVAQLVCISFPSGSSLPELRRALEILTGLYAPGSPYALAVGGTFDETAPREISADGFEGFSISNSAQDFQGWLRSQFPEFPSGQSRRIA